MNARKSVVITGVTSGIGLACVHQVVAAGFHVYGLARRHDLLQKLAETYPQQFTPFTCDLANRGQLQEAVEMIRNQPDELVALVNNAGLMKIADTHTMPMADVDQEIEVLFRAPYFLTRELLPKMITQKSGIIINMTSVAGMRPSAKMTAYAAMKAALMHFTQSIAAEYADRGIRAVSISPGIVETDLMNKVLMAMIARKIPLKRLSKPEEIAKVVVTLLGETGSYATGSNWVLDGGLALT